MKKIFITGAEGFIGSHLVEFLVNKNFKVKALVQYNSFNSWGWLDNLEKKIKKKIDVVLGDVRDLDEMLIHTKNQDAIIHLAALIGIPYSYISQKNYIETNTIGTLNIMQAAKKNKIKRIIHTSTSEVYGTAEYVPIDERHPIKAQSPYSASKISADQVAISFNKSFNLPVTILRPFNTFGPRQSNRAIIPTIMSQILTNNPIVKLGNTKPKRDFSYIDDTIKGFYLALISKNKNIYGETINLGSGYDISISELFQMIQKIAGKKVYLKIENKRKRALKSEVYRLKASNKKAKKLLNWIPKYHGKKGLYKALVLTFKWLKNNRNDNKSSTYNI